MPLLLRQLRALLLLLPLLTPAPVSVSSTPSDEQPYPLPPSRDDHQPPGDPQHQGSWTLSTALMNLSFAPSGAVTSLVDAATGRNVLSPTEASTLVTVRFPPRLCPPGHMGACPPCICTPVPATAVELSGSTLRAVVAGQGPVRLEVAMAVSSGYPADSLVFSVLSLSCANCTKLENWSEMVELNLLNLSVALPMCANTASASYDSTFGISLVPADYFTLTSGVASSAAVGGSAASCNLLASSSPASARCVAAAGSHCGSASLWGGPRSGLLSSFEAAELAFQLPSPRTANGKWLKTAPVASTGYIMASGIDQNNFAEMIQLVKASGMKMVVLLNAVANSGHYTVQPGWSSIASLASAVKLAHAQGILVGLHTMSASIPVQDSYITPEPDPRLAALTGWTLVGAINASTTHIRLDKIVAPGWGLGTTLRIGDELIKFTSSSAPTTGGRSNASSTLSGVVRGAYNTTAAPHLDGEPVSHLREMFGFLPDPASDLLEEIGENLAELVDAVDCDYIYFDGIEGLSIWGTDAETRFHRAFWNPVKRKDILVQSSGNAGELWHLNTRSGQRDWGATDTRAFFSHFGARDVAAAAQDLQVPDIGWWPYNVYVAGSFYATTPDEVEFMAAQAAAWGAAQMLETDLGWLSANGRTVDALQRSGNWCDVVLPDGIKERIRTSKMVDFQLFHRPNVDGWFIRQLFYHPPFVSEAAGGRWSLKPVFPACHSTVTGVRARVLTALVEDSSGQNLMLYGEGTQATTYLGPPGSSTLNASVTFPSVAGVVKAMLKLNYSSAVGTADAMALFTEVFVWPIDLTGHTAIQVALCGDGSNATLVVRLTDSEGEYRNFFLADLNFAGWRNITVHAPQTRQLFEYPLIAQNTAMRYFRWGQITSMTIAVTNALSANIAISSIVARSEAPAALSSGAVIEAGGELFSLPEGLQAKPCSAMACEWTGLGCFPIPAVASCNDYAECSRSGCQSFDANNVNLSRPVHGRKEKATPRGSPSAGSVARRDQEDVKPSGNDRNCDIAVHYTGGQASRARVEITVIEQSSEVLGPFASKIDGK